MYTLALIADIVLVVVLLYGYTKTICILSSLLEIMNKKENKKESKATQARDPEYYSDISSDSEACTEHTTDCVSQENNREKRTIFDTVLRVPEIVEASNFFERATTPMPIVDQQLLLDTLREASRQGSFTRQARTSKSVVDNTDISQQRLNSRGPLLNDGV